MLLKELTYHAPQTLPEALKLYSTLPNVRLQAGGTFLLNSLKLLKHNDVKTPEHVIGLNKIPDLKGISFQNNELILGSMTTITDIFESDLLKDNFSVLKTVCRNISTTPIRNMATVGGNLTCRYTWTEMPAVMIGLDAKLHFVAKDGTKETLDAENFFQSAAKTEKILTHIIIKQDKKLSLSYQRVKKSPHVDIPLLSMLLTTIFEGDRFTQTRVAINNCVAFAQRDKILEDFLNKSQISSTIATEALDRLDKSIYDTRSTEYKSHMFRVCVKNAIKELIAAKK